jgi:hypothetical protein
MRERREVRRKGDGMQTPRGPGVAPAGGIFTGESMSTMCDEIDFRMRRLESEASHERMHRLETEAAHDPLVGPPHSLGRRLGHALRTLGHGNHHLRPRHPIAHWHRP